MRLSSRNRRQPTTEPTAPPLRLRAGAAWHQRHHPRAEGRVPEVVFGNRLLVLSTRTIDPPLHTAPASRATGTCRRCYAQTVRVTRTVTGTGKSLLRVLGNPCYGCREIPVTGAGKSLLRVPGIDDRRNTAQLFEADMKVSFDEKMTEIRAHREAWTKSRKQTQARRARARPSVCD